MVFLDDTRGDFSAYGNSGWRDKHRFRKIFLNLFDL